MTVSKRKSPDRVGSWVEMNWDGNSSGSGPSSALDQPGASTGLGYDLA